MSSDVDLIMDELFKCSERIDLGLENKGGDIWMRCPWHGDGKERSGSLRLTIDDSSTFFQRFKCYGCGVYGHWNDIAKHFHLQRTDRNFKAVGVKKLSFRDKLAKVQSENAGTYYKRSEFDWPKGRKWRGIPAHVVRNNHGHLTDTKHILDEPRLILPVEVWGEIVGYIYALINNSPVDENGKKLEKSYLNAKGDWKEKCVYGFDRARKMLKKNPHLPLWIVEGPRDRLWLEAAGCAVVSALGSSFSKEKAELVKVLNPKRILVATDADEAGDHLAESIHELLHQVIPLTKINWKPGQDPCDQSLERLRQINSRFTYVEKSRRRIKSRAKARGPKRVAKRSERVLSKASR